MSQSAQPETPWMEVFRAGDYGPKGAFTAADLEQIADSYDPAWHEAPVVLGHPKSDAPAYGWVSKLKAVSGTLLAKLRQVDPKFRESVDQGRFKKRSVALYRVDKGNGASGWYLRHLGFLGAMPPEVKGLTDASFGQEEFESYDFDEERIMADDNKGMVEGVKQALRELFGGGSPQQPQFSESGVKQLIEAEAAKNKAQFEEGLKTEREKREKVETEFAEFKKTQAMAGLSQRAKDAILGLKANKRWLPAYEKMGVPQLFEALSTGNVTEIEFGEGDKKQKKDALQLFADVLEGIGKIVPEGALPIGQPSAAPTFKEGVDPKSVLFDEAVKARAKEKNIVYTEAYKQLVSEGFKPEENAGDATAGKV
jgi:hypothetical protein